MHFAGYRPSSVWWARDCICRTKNIKRAALHTQNHRKCKLRIFIFIVMTIFTRMELNESTSEFTKYETEKRKKKISKNKAKCKRFMIYDGMHVCVSVCLVAAAHRMRYEAIKEWLTQFFSPSLPCRWWCRDEKLYVCILTGRNNLMSEIDYFISVLKETSVLRTTIHELRI